MTIALLRLTAVVAATVLVAACVPSTEPGGRNPYCVYAGDTIGWLSEADRTTYIITYCHWLIADHTTCFDSRVGHLETATACVVGTKSPGSP